MWTDDVDSYGQPYTLAPKPLCVYGRRREFVSDRTARPARAASLRLQPGIARQTPGSPPGPTRTRDLRIEGRYRGSRDALGHRVDRGRGQRSCTRARDAPTSRP